jgi:hypothetical protein
MAEQNQEHQHHHHHHHHKRDGASLFKEKSLNAIKRNRIIEKWLKIALCCVAVLMGLLVVLAYLFG